MSTIVEFLQKKGFEIKEDPNAVVPEGGYELLVQEFSADKKARIQSDNFTNERHNKEKQQPKPAVVVEEQPVVKEPVAAPVVKEVVAEPVKETPKTETPTIKVTGRIDLDALNRKKAQPKKEELKKAEPKKEEPVAVVTPVIEQPKQSEEPKKAEEPQAQLTQVDEVAAPKLNIVGQIDLAAINQSTRPKKKRRRRRRRSVRRRTNSARSSVSSSARRSARTTRAAKRRNASASTASVSTSTMSKRTMAATTVTATATTTGIGAQTATRATTSHRVAARTVTASTNVSTRTM